VAYGTWPRSCEVTGRAPLFFISSFSFLRRGLPPSPFRPQDGLKGICQRLPQECGCTFPPLRTIHWTVLKSLLFLEGAVVRFKPDLPSYLRVQVLSPSAPASSGLRSLLLELLSRGIFFQPHQFWRELSCLSPNSPHSEDPFPLVENRDRSSRLIIPSLVWLFREKRVFKKYRSLPCPIEERLFSVPPSNVWRRHSAALTLLKQRAFMPRSFRECHSG